MDKKPFEQLLDEYALAMLQNDCDTRYGYQPTHDTDTLRASLIALATRGAEDAARHRGMMTNTALIVGNIERAVAWLSTCEDESDPLETRVTIARNELAEALQHIAEESR